MLQLRVVSQFLLGVAALGLGSQVAATAPTPASEAIARLRHGNAGFVAHPDGALPIDVATRTALAQGQSPFAAVLSCADSRVPPEVELEGLDYAEYETDVYPEHAREEEKIIEPDGTVVPSEQVLVGAWREVSGR